MNGIVSDYLTLLYDVASGSEITLCNAIDKLTDLWESYDVHNNVA